MLAFGCVALLARPKWRYIKAMVWGLFFLRETPQPHPKNTKATSHPNPRWGWVIWEKSSPTSSDRFVLWTSLIFLEVGNTQERSCPKKTLLSGLLDWKSSCVYGFFLIPSTSPRRNRDPENLFSLLDSCRFLGFLCFSKARKGCFAIPF